MIFGTTANDFDIRLLQDVAEDRIKPILERAPGISEINVLGGRERELQVRIEPDVLAQRGITLARLVDALRTTNRNVSAGEISSGKLDVRVRTVNEYASVRDVEDTVIMSTPTGSITVGDVAEVVETHKEPTSFVRSKGRPVIAVNAQREVGTNVIEVMNGLREAIAEINVPGGLLDTEAKRLGINGIFTFELVYDQTVYIDDALGMVTENIWLGGLLATLSLVLFLRSARAGDGSLKRE
jgi:HAE1 family hydrophobic/amphiphilic exporter-1